MTDAWGVVIGRFQCARPHAGHVELITRVHARHPTRTLILIGHSPGFPSPRDPLPLDLRVRMIQSHFPVLVAGVPDAPTDAAWSAGLDTIVRRTVDGAPALLYGGRDNCLRHYTGAYPTHTLDLWTPTTTSATSARDSIVPQIQEAFLEGVIYAPRLRAPISYQAVDVVVEHEQTGRVLLGQKLEDGDRWRLPGGFVDPTDATLEAAAVREVREEVRGLECGVRPRYLGSFRIDDYRYRSGPDRILTALFVVPYLWGLPTAADDLHACAWFARDRVRAVIHPMHRRLIDAYLAQCPGGPTP